MNKKIMKLAVATINSQSHDIFGIIPTMNDLTEKTFNTDWARYKIER